MLLILGHLLGESDRTVCNLLLLLSLDCFLAFGELVPCLAQPRGDLLRAIPPILDEVKQMLGVCRDAERGKLIQARLSTPVLVET